MYGVYPSAVLQIPNLVCLCEPALNIRLPFAQELFFARAVEIRSRPFQQIRQILLVSAVVRDENIQLFLIQLLCRESER